MKLKHIRQQGVTLLEMMITVAIISIVLTVVAPNVQTILIKNRIIAEINELSSVVQFARNSAIDEQASAVICPSSDFKTCSTDWSLPKIVFVDINVNQEREDTEPLLVATERLSEVNRLSGPNTPIRFDDNGAAMAASVLILCHESNLAQYARQIEVNLQGRVKLSQDSDADGIHEDTSGDNLTCSN